MITYFLIQKPYRFFLLILIWIVFLLTYNLNAISLYTISPFLLFIQIKIHPLGVISVLDSIKGFLNCFILLYISPKTSYLIVRLEFLHQPQLVPHYCNNDGFNPPPFLLGFNLVITRSLSFESIYLYFFSFFFALQARINK